jgi:hypothetical protein
MFFYMYGYTCSVRNSLRTAGAQMERPYNETSFWYTLNDEAKLRGALL